MKPFKYKKKEFSYFIKLLGLIWLVVLILAFFVYKDDRSTRLDILFETEVKKLGLQMDEINSDFDFLARDVLLLRDLVLLIDKYSENYSRSLNMLKEEFSLFLKEKKI